MFSMIDMMSVMMGERREECSSTRSPISGNICYLSCVHVHVHPTMASSSSEKIEQDLDTCPLLENEVDLGAIDAAIESKRRQPRRYLHHSYTIPKAIANALLPSFLVKSSDRRKITPTPNQNVASLDGLRGIACLIVVNQHFTYNFTEQIFAGWGTTPTAYYIPQLPFVCVLWSGQAMVSVFFVVSGFVLSYKPLRLVRAKAWDKLHENMSSAAFRRLIRLYVPMTGSLLLITVMTTIGLFEPARTVKASGILTGNEEVPFRFDTFGRQLWECWLNVWLQIHPAMASSTLDFHLWTLPVELRTSFTLFLTLIALSRLKYLWRTAITIVLVIFCIWLRRDAQIMFYSGMMLADLDQCLTGATARPAVGGHCASIKPRKLVTAAYIATFVTGLYFASTPYWGLSGPFFGHLRLLNPPSFGTEGTWLKIVGATLITLSVNQCGALQPLCTNAFAQYLGKVRCAACTRSLRLRFDANQGADLLRPVPLPWFGHPFVGLYSHSIRVQTIGG